MMVASAPDRVQLAASQTLMPKMMGGAITAAQACAYLQRVLTPDELDRVPATFESWRLAYPDEVRFFDAICTALRSE